MDYGVGVHNILWSMDEWVHVDNLFAPHMSTQFATF